MLRFEKVAGMGSHRLAASRSPPRRLRDPLQVGNSPGERRRHATLQWSTCRVLLVAAGMLAMLPALQLPALHAQHGPARALLGPVPASGQELLALYGIDADGLKRFQDNEPLDASQAETLARLLYHLPRIPRATVEHLSRENHVELSRLAAEPHGYLGSVVRLVGRAKRVEKIPVPNDVARRTEFGEYYQVTLEMAGASAVLVMARIVPRNWPCGADLDEPASAAAFFIRAERGADANRQLTFAAHRVAWHPDAARPALGATEDHVLLARLGLDVGLLSEERDLNRKPIVSEDRECFYQLLSAMSRASPGTINQREPRPIVLGDLLQHPELHHGEIMLVEGQARQVTKVRVDELDIQQRFGLDHYYQIDMFVPLKNQIVRFSQSSEATAVPTYENAYPITVCVPSLPPGLDSNDALPVGIRLPAAFFKLWAYRSEYVSSFHKDHRQLSPMLIGLQPQVVTAESFNLGLGTGLMVAIAIALLGTWIGLARFGRDRSLVRQTLLDEPMRRISKR